jgi:quercetin dioxygenase-like cupin family protein
VKRTYELQLFIDATQAMIAASGATEAALIVADRIFSAAQLTGEQHAHQANQLPACAFLQPALASASADLGPVADLAAAIEHLAAKLCWTRRPNGDKDNSEFKAQHANALVVGPQGLEIRSDIQIGITVLAPHTHYPDHHHSPEEIYAALSPSQWRQNADPWHSPGGGGYVHNVPNIVHSMRSNEDSLLAVWCLWGSG